MASLKQIKFLKYAVTNLVLYHCYYTGSGFRSSSKPQESMA